MSNTKKILFLISALLDGGTETTLLQYLNYLSKDTNLEITLGILLDFKEKEVFLKHIPQNIKIVHILNNIILSYRLTHPMYTPIKRVVKALDELFINPIRRIYLTNKIEQLASNYDVLIDFSNDFYHYTKNINIKKIVWLHFSIKAFLDKKYCSIKKYYKKLHKYDYIISITETMYNEAITYLPKLKDKFRLMRNAINIDDIKTKSNEYIDNPLLNNNYICTVTRLEEKLKDVTTLIKAYANLRKKYNCQELLYIVGNGNSLNQLKQVCKDNQIEDYVKFIGFQNNPFPWIKNGKIFVLSSHSEGLGMVLVEAMALNKVIIATDCPSGPKEVLDNGNCGLLVKENDVEGLTECLYRALTDKELQLTLQNNGRSQIQKFSFDTISTQLYKLL